MQGREFIGMFNGVGLFSAEATCAGMRPLLEIYIAGYDRNVASVGVVGSVPEATWTEAFSRPSFTKVP